MIESIKAIITGATGIVGEKKMGLAIINSVLKGYDKQVLEVKDIIHLAK